MKKMEAIKKSILMLLVLISLTVMVVPAISMNTYASEQKKSDQQKASTIEEVTAPVEDLIKKLTAPLLGVVGALGSVFCIILGVKFAKAEEPQEREKAKAHLKNAIIGFVLIFVLLLVLNRSITPLTNWVTQNSAGSGL